MSETFWAKQAQRIDWFKPFSKIKDCSFIGDIYIRWFEDGKLNVSYNCIDRHLNTRGDKTAIIWEPNDPQKPAQHISFKELYKQVNHWAAVLKSQGVQKGDRVTIYLPMIPEAAYAMLACTRIGAVHSVVFAGFSAEALAGRINDCESKLVITADEGLRGNKHIPLKACVDEAISKAPIVEKVLVVKHTGSLERCQVEAMSPRPPSRGPEYDKGTGSRLKAGMTADCNHVVEPEPMNAEDPLFILYTSGSTNTPKGVLHTTAGYLVYAAWTHETVFGCQEDDVYFCTADVGWITGHSYGIYGPLANGITTVMFEGVPNWPNPSRFWEIIDKHQVNIFYTAPTAIRALMKEGDSWVQNSSRKSLRVLGTVGEPINPEAWNWYHDIVGKKRCTIVDTWWQTETGGIMISPRYDAKDLKPGSAMSPLPNIQPEILDDKGRIITGPGEGNLCLADSWPGQARTLYKDHKRFKEVYFEPFPDKYFTGDGCKRDEDGHYWITGRVDDVMNISGHRIGTAEVESALVAHPSVAEAAVVAYPHDIKGQGIYAYVTLKSGIDPCDSLKSSLLKQVRKEISPIATPDIIQWAPELPKTRSGKIMRRILRKISEKNTENLGDISTLADPKIIETLIAGSV